MMKTRNLLLQALFLTLVTISTLSIQIPLPNLNGYFNLGDFVIMSFVIISGQAGFFLAAGLGAALADVLTPYAVYAPFTFVTKALEYVVVYFLYKKLKNQNIKTTIPFLVGGLIISIGYAITDMILAGSGAFFPSLVINGIQGIVAATITIILQPIIAQIKKHYPKGKL